MIEQFVSIEEDIKETFAGYRVCVIDSTLEAGDVVVIEGYRDVSEGIIETAWI